MINEGLKTVSKKKRGVKDIKFESLLLNGGYSSTKI
jgi:hypothetical protein